MANQVQFPDRQTLGPAIRWAAIIIAVALLLLGLSIGTDIYTDWAWFDSLGYLSVYTTILGSRVTLFAIGALLFLPVFAVNAWAAHRLSPQGISPQAVLEVPIELLNWGRQLLLLGIILAGLLFTVLFGFASAGGWEVALWYINAASFNLPDPLFHQDASFYLFSLPLFRFAQEWLIGAVIVLGLSAMGIYAVNFALGGFRFTLTPPIRAHLSILGSLFFLLLAWGYWMDSFELVRSIEGAAYGAAYTDVNARLPGLRIMIVVAVLAAAALLANVFLRRQRLPLVAIGGWGVALAVLLFVYPAGVQRLQVDPAEFTLEQPYIERTIAMTRNAFALDRIETRQYPVDPQVTRADVDENPLTMKNVRLWDYRPLRDVYNQLQFFRLQYSFPDIDVDRYVVEGDYLQVMVGTRELVFDQLPSDARTWVNERLQYTHGYGAAISPVTQFTEEKGEPFFLLKDIPPAGSPDLAVEKPQIYYGEATTNYVITNSNTPEFDHPTDAGPVYRSYEGTAGIRLDSLLQRLVFAWRFRDLNMLISGEITPESRLLFRRAIQERVHTLAPFLRLDDDPYMTVVNGRLYWIQDAYTVSDRFPYSEPAPEGFNYIRNSVKVVIGAYDGTVDFYVADPSDGIIQTYQSIFPTLFKPLDAMPEGIRAHIRYPEDFFRVQAQKYLKFHMTEPQVFYNQEDLWTIPQETFFGGPQRMEPYYLIMRFPEEAREEFVLILPFTPSNKPNLVAWLAARNDPPHYSRLLAYTFPKERQIDGPQQVEASIDNDPVISAQFTLWGTGGSVVLRGNLIVIPLGDTILYVEPIYLQAANLAFPQLKRVIVAAQGVAPKMEPSLATSLNALLGEAPVVTPPGPQPPTGPPSTLAQEVERIRAVLKDLQAQFQALAGALEKLLEAASKEGSKP
ncbi:MAG: UPF0182 family protein [Chloroflexi bacterium]|nr:UPF0182 family protein [Chloroflexota bacterium]